MMITLYFTICARLLEAVSPFFFNLFSTLTGVSRSDTNRNSASSPFLFRLQTGHCKLNAHMHRIGFHSTGLCSTCSVPEDVNHFLLICPKYEHSRSVLNSHLNSMGLRLTMQTLSCPQAFSSLINFVKTSGAIV